MSKETRAIIVNQQTGEEIGKIFDGDMIVRKESLAKLQSTDKWTLDGFYKANVPELRLWLKDLSQAEKAFLFSVAPYISYEDCHICYDNGQDIGTEGMAKITGMSRAVIYRTLDSLISKDIIYKGKNSRNRQYFVNPWLFCKGNRINKVLRTMFKNYRIRMLNNKRWGSIKNF